MRVTTAILLALVLVLVGLMYFNQGRMNTLIAERVGHTFTCVDGVSYVIFPNGASVQYNENGTIKACK